jgi:acetylornithine deacetylase/succinyl-diaminopimelate desuccinylase-like protein
MDNVKSVISEEEALNEAIEFHLEEYKDGTKVKFMSNRSRCSCTACAFRPSGPGANTVIPAKVTVKFSIRLVPDQNPAQIEKTVKTHIECCHTSSTHSAARSWSVNLCSAFSPRSCSPQLKSPNKELYITPLSPILRCGYLGN